MAINPLKIDPTRTTTLRRRYVAEMSRRFRRLKKKINDLLIEEDAFGLRPATKNPFTGNAEDFASTQLDLPAMTGIRELRYRISSEHLHEKGREDKPHITVRYGLHSKDTEDVRPIIERFSPIEITLGKTSHFEAEEFDVVKVDVESPALRALHKALGVVPHTDTHATYNPHLTLAYVQKGYGKLYDGWTALEGLKYTFHAVTFSTKDRDKVYIALLGITFNNCGTGAGGFKQGNTCQRGGRKAVPLDADPYEVYPEAPRVDTNVNDFTYYTQMKEAGRTGKSTIDGKESIKLYHVTLDENASAILNKSGLVPGGSEASGQSFKATHADYATYFHTSKEVAVRDVTHGVGFTLIEAQIPISHKVLRRIIPDEDVSNNPNLGLKTLIEGGPIAFIGGVPKKYLRRVNVDPLTINTRWRFLTTPQQLEAFVVWLQAQVASDILEKVGERQDELWLQRYIEEGYKAGLARVFADVKKPFAQGGRFEFYIGGRDQFLRDSFFRPVAIERVKLLAARSFNDLKGITEAMSQQISRELVDGMIQGLGPREVARKINNRVDKIGRTRALMLARTETVRAHADGQLDALEALGVEEVGVAVEWSTAKDFKVCPECRAMSGVVFKVAESRGLIPRHPSCRCAFLPANVGESTKGQKRSQGSIKRAIDDSIRAELPKKTKRSLAEQKRRTKWAGADKTIAKKRPKSIL